MKIDPRDGDGHRTFLGFIGCHGDHLSPERASEIYTRARIRATLPPGCARREDRVDAYVKRLCAPVDPWSWIRTATDSDATREQLRDEFLADQRSRLGGSSDMVP